MKLIACLGNPGAQYHFTRHNIGFLIGDYLQNTRGFPEWSFDKKSNSLISKDSNIILAKPQTFMNRSGSSVSALQEFYKIEQHDIIVIHDDLDLAFDTIKLKLSGSAGGHNGLKDIIQHLGSDEIARIRVGIGRPSHPQADISNYVLSQLSSDNQEKLVYISDDVTKLLEKEFLL